MVLRRRPEAVAFFVWGPEWVVGRVAEWLKAHDWKSCGLTPAWVRIPPRPWQDARSVGVGFKPTGPRSASRHGDQRGLASPSSTRGVDGRIPPRPLELPE